MKIDEADRDKRKAIRWFYALCMEGKRFETLPANVLENLLGDLKPYKVKTNRTKKEWLEDFRKAWNCLWTNSYTDNPGPPLVPEGVEEKINDVKVWAFAITTRGKHTPKRGLERTYGDGYRGKENRVHYALRQKAGDSIYGTPSANQKRNRYGIDV